MRDKRLKKGLYGIIVTLILVASVVAVMPTAMGTVGVCINGYKFNENNQPLSGWTIEVYDSYGNYRGQNITDDNGKWEICKLSPSNGNYYYVVTEVPQQGWKQLEPKNGNYTIRIYANGTVTDTSGNAIELIFKNQELQCGLSVNKTCSVASSPLQASAGVNGLKLGCNPTPTPTPTPTPPVFTNDCECMAGAEVTYSYEVTNTGDDLTDVTVEDDKLGTIAEPFDLAQGETQTFTKTATISETTTNMVTVTGEFPDGDECSATDTTTVTVSVYESQCGLIVNKTCSVPSSPLKATAGVDGSKLGCNPTPTPTPPVFTDNCECMASTAGTKVTYSYEVTNTGDDDLTNVRVIDDRLGSITWWPFTLAPGETRTFTKTATISKNTTNTVNVTGVLTDGDECSATDTTTVTIYKVSPGTGTPGYWKNHPEAWPVDQITIGGRTYTKTWAIKLMSMSDRLDKTYTMFRALVAAKLNVLIGNDDSCIKDTISAADTWMKTHPVGSGVKANSAAWKQGEPLYLKLDEYNNGLLCAPHRD